MSISPITSIFPPQIKEQGQDSFIEAVRTGNIPIVQHLLQAGADPNIEIQQPDGSITFPLYEAFKRAKTDMAKCLMDAGADADKVVTLADGRTTTALLTALAYADERSFELLLQGSKEQIIKENDGSATAAIFKEINRIFKLYGPETLGPVRNEEEQRLSSSLAIQGLLNKGANPNTYILQENGSMTTLLYEAVKARDTNLLKMFLNQGGDPNKRVVDQFEITSPFQKGASDLLLAGIFFAYSKPEFKPDVAQAINTLEKEAYLSPEKRVRIAKATAKGLPPVHNVRYETDGVSFHTKFVSRKLRNKIIECYFDPLFNPPGAAREFIFPLAAYAKKSIPEIFVLGKCSDRFGFESLGGSYSIIEKNITLFLDNEKPEIEKMEKSTALIHELTHKIDFEVGRLSDDSLVCMERVSLLQQAVLDEIKALNKLNCDSAIQKNLDGISYSYPENERLYEYIARFPQIVFDMANRGTSSEDMEAILKRDIPNLFKLYKEEILPTLRKYLA